MLIRPSFMILPRKKVIARAQPIDPDEQRRINDNNKWRADQPEEDVWDIDKERDAIRYKKESLESMLRLKTHEEKNVDKDKDGKQTND